MATNYWLTFRFADVTVGYDSGDDRRNALYQVIDNLSRSWWIEPTSFLLFHSELGIDEIAGRCKAVISVKHDLVLLREISVQSARVIGSPDYLDTLEAFMPYLRKA